MSMQDCEAVRPKGFPLLSSDRKAAGIPFRVSRSKAGIFSLSRNELFAGLAALAFLNGISERIAMAVRENGVPAALMSTFDISIIVWAACGIGLSFLLRDPPQPVSRADRVVAALALAALLLPVVPISWLALSGLTVYIVKSSAPSSFMHRGAWILLAMTVPMLWGRLLFAVFSDAILRGDAALVGWLVGTPRIGNAIQFADGSGYLWIAPACSSLANVSLAVLCWVTLAKVENRPSSWRDAGWILAAACAVIAVNVVRIGLLGLYRESFETLHGPVGATIASLLILVLTVAICQIGIRHAPARA
ncbi:hypothetical protein GDR74_17610 [Microvirga thermotolerans]|uniref:Exosortase/archaeosortase family protein n=2 Tax=Microvirga thermotolerans TaxID=2651334 RepID=A0A5P9JZK5_9HYPH|nr:hypothetical protein GDR74_17610 [Microvirga thermotolerans]